MSGMGVLADYLDYSRRLVLEEIRAIVPVDRRDTGGLYRLMLDYPLRHGKSMRPALSIAMCRAKGGSLAAVLPTAAVLELYHNAFLIHDDIEDQSYLRRAEATLSRMHGVPTAINVGDGMLALTMQPLLDNTARIGLGEDTEGASHCGAHGSGKCRRPDAGAALDLGWHVGTGRQGLRAAGSQENRMVIVHRTRDGRGHHRRCGRSRDCPDRLVLHTSRNCVPNPG